MTEDGLFLCKAPGVTVKGGRMSEREDASATVIELLLREPEIIRWLEPEEAPEDDDDDYEPPRAA
jgi:hypothetical protein